MGIKTHILLVFGILLMLCYFFVPDASKKTNLIELSVDKSDIDLGNFSKNQRVTATFVLKNVHSKIVHILDPETSCGCSEVSVVEKDLQPQKSTKIFVNIDTRNSVGIYVVSVLVPYQANIDDVKKYLNLVVRFEVVD
jgi:hypothetical protein